MFARREANAKCVKSKQEYRYRCVVQLRKNRIRNKHILKHLRVALICKKFRVTCLI